MHPFGIMYLCVTTYSRCRGELTITNMQPELNINCDNGKGFKFPYTKVCGQGLHIGPATLYLIDA